MVHELLNFGNWEFVRRLTRDEVLAMNLSYGYAQHFVVRCKTCNKECVRAAVSLVNGHSKGCVDCYRERIRVNSYPYQVGYRLTTVQLVSLAGVTRKHNAVPNAIRAAIDYWLANCSEPVFEKPPKYTPQGVVKLTAEQYQALDKLPTSKSNCIYTAVQYYLNNADLSSPKTVPSNWLDRQQQATLDNGNNGQCLES